MPRPAVFRLQRDERSSGPYFTLVKGKKEPLFIALGHLPEDEAQRCLEAIRQHDEAGRLDAMVRLWRSETGGRDALIRFLLSTTGADLDEALGPAPTDYSKMTLSDYFETVYKAERKAKRPATWRTEERNWPQLKAALGGLRLRDINEYVVDEFLDGLKLKSGEPASYNTKRLYRAAIAALLQFARRKGHHRVPMPQFFRLEGSAKRRMPEPEPLTNDELLALLEEAPSLKHRALFAVCFSSGMRPREVTRTDWADVDWKRSGEGYEGALSVRGSKTDGSRAWIPLLPLARRELETWWREMGEPTSGVIFPARPGKAYSEDNSGTFRKALKSAAVRAGITDKRIFPYLGRHTVGTALVEAGVPMQTVAKVLRHSNPRMLEKHYDHTGALRAPGLERAPAYVVPEPEPEPTPDDDREATFLDLVR
jgi:integrase